MDSPHSDDDSQHTLAQIARHHGRSIIEMLLQIQKARTEEWKPTKFLQPLECLQLIDRPIRDTRLKNTMTETAKPLDEITVQDILEDTQVPWWLSWVMRKAKKAKADALQNEKRFLQRSYLNVLGGQTDYVAVSYTWDPPDGHDSSSGRYWVANKTGDGGFEQSPIRNNLLDRITNYMRASGVKHFWIDQHCIVQTTTCTMSRCDHDDCHEKREAVHAMDLVFTSSKYPVAFLSRSINTVEQLHSLRELFSLTADEFISSTASVVPDVNQQQSISIRPVQLHQVHIRRLKAMLKIVHNLICDPWWTRAWPFQERYVTDSRLRLLWRHAPHLEERKLALFPSESQLVPGEISVRPSEFITQAVMLCDVMRQQHMTTKKKLGVEETEMIDQVLQAVVHDEPFWVSGPTGPSISPLVTAVVSKDIAKPWDRVAILGNCCRYSMRLESQYLQHKGASLSLSILALVLLNGEVLNNNNNNVRKEHRNQLQTAISDMTISQYLSHKTHCKSGSSSSHRIGFIDVTFTTKGIRTRGHLWKLGEVFDTSFEGLIDTTTCPLTSYDKWPTDGSQKANEYRCWWRAARCRKLVETLESSGYSLLAEKFRRLIEHAVTDCLFKPTKHITPQLPLGTIKVVDAIGRGQRVRLGRLWHPGLPERPASYCALFLWEKEHGKPNMSSTSDQGLPPVQKNNRIYSGPRTPEMVFTATRVSDFGSSALEFHLDPDPSSLHPRHPRHSHNEVFLNEVNLNFHRYLSLQVLIENASPKTENTVFSPGNITDNLPSLRTAGQRVSCITFPEICMHPSRLVVFPWPSELAAIGSGGRWRSRKDGSGLSRRKIYDEIARGLYGWEPGHASDGR